MQVTLLLAIFFQRHHVIARFSEAGISTALTPAYNYNESTLLATV
jgi:hypothetical protein